MKYIFIIYLFVITPIFAQTDWNYWTRTTNDYLIPSTQSEKKHDEKEISVMSELQDGYSFFISDLDGDNCPFYPTCSSFFVSSVAKTNIFQGTLMFADRFTRDSNLFKSHNHYAVHKSGRLYDPVENYLLLESEFITPNHEHDK